MMATEMFGSFFGLVRAAFLAAAIGAAVYVAQPYLAKVDLPASAGNAEAATAAPATFRLQARADGTVSVTLTDADLTRLAQTRFPQSFLGVTVSDPKVRISSGKVALGATASSILGSGPLVATAVPAAADGRLLLMVQSVTVGGSEVPDGVRSAFEAQLNSVLEASLAKVRVTGVTTANGALTVSGSPAS